MHYAKWQEDRKSVAAGFFGDPPTPSPKAWTLLRLMLCLGLDSQFYSKDKVT